MESQAPKSACDPPILENEKSYKQWRNAILMWSIVTNVEPEKRALVVALRLSGKARELALEIDSEELNRANGLATLLSRLDTKFKFKETEIYRSFQKLENALKLPSQPMDTYVASFQQLCASARAVGASIPERVLAYILLNRSGLTQAKQEEILEATGELSLDKISDALLVKNPYSQTSIFSTSSRIHDSPFRLPPVVCGAPDDIPARQVTSSSNDLVKTAFGTAFEANRGKNRHSGFRFSGTNSSSQIGKTGFRFGNSNDVISSPGFKFGTSTSSSKDFSIGAPRTVSFSSISTKRRAEIANIQNEDDDVVCTGEILASKEEQQKAKSLQLPQHFFNSLKKPKLDAEDLSKAEDEETGNGAASSVTVVASSIEAQEAPSTSFGVILQTPIEAPGHSSDNFSKHDSSQDEEEQEKTEDHRDPANIVCDAEFEPVFKKTSPITDGIVDEEKEEISQETPSGGESIRTGPADVDADHEKDAKAADLLTHWGASIH